MKASSLFIVAAALVAAALLTLLGLSSLSSPDQNKNAAAAPTALTPLESPVVAFGNPFRGAKDAPLTIVEFGDYQCEPCADMESTLFKILEKFGAKVRIVWKDFPDARLHAEAFNAAAAARCAGDQDAFWEYHDLLLANAASVNGSAYAVFAKELGLDTNEFAACFAGKRTLPLVERDLEEGLRLRVDGTPYLFIGKRRVSGALSYEQLSAMIESELALANNADKK